METSFSIASLGGGHHLGCGLNLANLPKVSIRDLPHAGNWTQVAEFTFDIDNIFHKLELFCISKVYTFFWISVQRSEIFSWSYRRYIHNIWKHSHIPALD